MAESTGILLLNAEDNDLSGLTITEEGSNDLTIAFGAALHGSLGYNFSFSGNTGENLLYFYKSFTASTDIYARCYFYVPSAFSMNSADFGLFSLRNFSNESIYLIRPTCTYSSGNLKFYRIYYRTNSGTAYIDVNVTISRDTLHYLETRYKSDASAGIIACYLDGNKIAEATGLATSSYTAGYVRTGNDQGGVPTAGSTIYIDDIKVDSSYIGQYTESGGTQDLEGSFSSSSEFTGQAILNIPIAGQFNSVSSLTGEAYLQYFLTGAFNSVSNISGLAGLSLQAQGQINSLSNIFGDAILDIGISGQITCTSLLSLTTSPEIFLQGSINSQSSVIGNIGLSFYVSGIIPVVSFMEILEEFNYQILSFNSEIRNEIYISSEIRNELNIKSAIKSIIKIGANMSLIDYFYDGQNAVQIRVYELGDLSDAVTCLIKYTKPNLTAGQWTATIDTENDGEIYYQMLNTEFFTAGNWTFWSHITYSDGRIGIGDPKTINIREEGK